ncbi:MAG: PEP-CTERM sorting domain-containing protein [Pirellulales bacterium]|jgi:hypothetical protein
MPRRLSLSRCISHALLRRSALLVLLLASGVAANAADFDVTLNYWGTTSTVGSFAWAVDQANTTPGVDTIRLQSGLQIDADNGAPLAGDATWLTRFTESVTVEGNGATLVANPSYVSSGGLLATKNNIIGSAYSPPLVSGDVVVTPGVSFAEVGIFGQDNSGLSVTIRNLNADGVASLLSVNDKATLNVDGGRFTNIVNYTGVDGRSAFDAREGATLNLDGIALNRNFPFGDIQPVGDDNVVFNGSISGGSSTLNMQNSTITGSYGAGALLWVGGTANIVSSILSNSGGLQITGEVGGTDGTLNFTNSILELNGGETLQQTQRILVDSDSVANVTASSILYNSIFTGGADQPFGNQGMPLTAALGGTLNFESSVVVPLNWDTFFAGNDTYIELTGGDLTADAFSFIMATASQDQAALQALFNNASLITSGDTFAISEITGVDFFESLPLGAVPLSTSPLVDAVSDAGVGGANELINPINGQPLLFDVYGSPRTNGLGFRNIGAVQAAPVPEPSSWVLAGMAAGTAGWWRLRRRSAKVSTLA